MTKKKTASAFLADKKPIGLLFSISYVSTYAAITGKINYDEFRFDHQGLIHSRPTIIVNHSSGLAMSLSYDEIIHDSVLVEGKYRNKSGNVVEVEEWFDVDDVYSALTFILEKLSGKKLK